MRVALVAALVVGVVVSGARGQSDRVLVDRFDRAYAAQDYETARDAAVTIAERHETSGLWAFNAACANAKVGELDEAKRWLTASAERGFQGVRSVETDADLDPIRETPEFEAALEMIRAASRARLEEFKREAANHTPASWVPEGATEDDPVPLLIALHGTGGDGDGMVRAWRAVCEKANVAIVAPDALRPAGSGFSWTYRDESEWLIRKVIADAVESMPVDPDRVVLTGFSQGANISMPFGIDEPGLFRGVIPICGHYEAEIVDLDSVAGEGGEDAGVRAPRYFFIIGARDPWSSTNRRAAVDFKGAGVETKLEVVPSRGHEIPSGRGGEVRLLRALEWCLRDPG